MEARRRSPLFGVFFVAAGFGAAINGVQRTSWGHLFNISALVGSIWVAPVRRGPCSQQRRRLLPHARGEELPLWCCWVALACSACICLYMLTRKIRGAEVIR